MSELYVIYILFAGLDRSPLRLTTRLLNCSGIAAHEHGT